MASMNIEMRLGLTDTASAPVKAFISTLEGLESAVGGASERLSALTASTRSLQTSSRTLGATLAKVAEGIAAINVAAGTGGQVHNFAAGLEKLAAALGLVKSSSTGVSAELGAIGNRAGGASLGTFKLEQSLAALGATLEGIVGKLAATTAGIGSVGSAATAVRAEAAGAMAAVGAGAQGSTEHVNTLASSIKGMAQLWGAFKIEKGLKTAVSDAAEYERTDNRLRNMNLSPGESDAIHQSVRQTGRDFHQFDQNELLEMAIDLRNATGSAHEAATGLKGFAESVFAINLSMPSGKKLDEQGTMNFAKFLEGRGVTMDPAAMAAQQDLITKIVAATQGRVNPNNLFGNLTYAKGGLGRTMDDQALVTFASMIEQDTIGGGTGGRVGTMLTSFVNSITKSSAITTKNRDEWLKLGLVDPGKVNVNENTNRVTSIQAGAIAGTEIVGKNFKKWVDDYLRPALIAAGVNMDDLTAVKTKTDMLFPNRNAAEAAFQLLSKKDLIEKDSANINQAAGKDQQVKNGEGLSAANWERFHKSINDLAIAIGTTLLPMLNPLLEGFTKIIEVLGHLSQDHPIFGFLLGLSGALGSVSLLIAGATRLFGPLGAVLGVTAESFGGFGAVVTAVGGFIAAAIPMILRWLLRLAGPIGLILLAWDAGLGEWLSKLEVFGHSAGDWAASLADKVVNAFQNMWVRTKQFFGFLSDDAAAAQIEANNRANGDKQRQLGFGSQRGGGKVASARGGASGDWGRDEEVTPASKATEDKVKSDKAIAAQLAANKAAVAGLGGGKPKGGRFKNYDEGLDDAKNDLRLEEDELSRHMKAEDELYKAQKISIGAYYDDKLATMRKSINAQIAELEREKAAYQRQGDRAGVNRTSSEITLRKRDLDDTEKSVAVQREKGLNALKEKGLQLDAQQLEAEGKKNQAVLAREVQRLTKDKQEYLLNGDQLHADLAQQAIDTAKLTASWEAYGDAVKKVQENTQTKEVQVDAEVKAGNLTKYEAEQKIFALRQEEARQLDELIAKERALIEASDAPQGVKDQRLKTLGLAQAKADSTLSEMNPEDARIKQALDNGIESSFTGFFKNIISGSKSAKDAFKDFGNSIANVVNQLVAEQLGKQLFQSLFGQAGVSMGNGGGGSPTGIGGALSSLFGGGLSGGPNGASSNGSGRESTAWSYDSSTDDAVDPAKLLNESGDSGGGNTAAGSSNSFAFLSGLFDSIGSSTSKDGPIGTTKKNPVYVYDVRSRPMAGDGGGETSNGGDSSFGGDGGGGGGGGGSSGGGILDGIKTFFSDTWDGVTKVAGDVWKGAKTVVGDVWDGAKTVVGDMWDGAKQFTSDVWSGVKKLFGGDQNTPDKPKEKKEEATGAVGADATGMASNGDISLSESDLAALATQSDQSGVSNIGSDAGNCCCAPGGMGGVSDGSSSADGGYGTSGDAGGGYDTLGDSGGGYYGPMDFGGGYDPFGGFDGYDTPGGFGNFGNGYDSFGGGYDPSGDLDGGYDISGDFFGDGLDGGYDIGSGGGTGTRKRKQGGNANGGGIGEMMSSLSSLMQQLFSGLFQGLQSLLSSLGSGLSGLFGGGGKGLPSGSGQLSSSDDPSSVVDNMNFGGDDGSGWGDWLDGLASFDVGTDNVPSDMIAQIHQGEMIVPKYDADRIRTGGAHQRPLQVTNHFTVAGTATRETLSQIALHAGLGVSRATRRNG